MRTRTGALGAAVLILVCAGISAQQDAKSPNAGKKPEDKREEVTYGAKLVKAAWGGGGTSLMKGDVWFQHADTRISSDLVQYDGSEKVKTATSPGSIKISNPECDITGEKGAAYFLKRLGVIEGSVVMLVKPKQEAAAPNDDESIRMKLRKPTTITCEKLEYLYRKKIASAVGKVVFQQEKRRATADKAVYDQKAELLTLTGGVNAVDEDGQTFSAPKAVISLKKGDEWIEAPDAKATLKIDLGEEEEPAPQ